MPHRLRPHCPACRAALLTEAERFCSACGAPTRLAAPRDPADAVADALRRSAAGPELTFGGFRFHAKW